MEPFENYMESSSLNTLEEGSRKIEKNANPILERSGDCMTNPRSQGVYVTFRGRVIRRIWIHKLQCFVESRRNGRRENATVGGMKSC